MRISEDLTLTKFYDAWKLFSASNGVSTLIEKEEIQPLIDALKLALEDETESEPSK